MKTSEKIKSARKRKGLTQKQLAEIVGAATATINKIEADDTKDTSIKNTSFNLAVKIATALDCDVFDLFGDETLKNESSKVSDKEIEKLKFIVFDSLDKFSTRQIFAKAMEENNENTEHYKEFNEFKDSILKIKTEILSILIEYRFCTIEDYDNWKMDILDNGKPAFRK